MFVSLSEISVTAYDAIIVGSGPAGATVARQLASHGKTSLILETGPLEYDSDVHEAYSGLYANGHYQNDHWVSHWFRVFGGTSTVWSGWCAPLTQRNLESWPLTAAELTAYYPDAAAVLGRTPDFLTYEAPFMTGFVARQFSVDDPLRVGEAYLEDFQTNQSIDVLLETNVTELFATPERNRVTGLRLFNRETGQQDIELRAGQELVLAAGGMGNAQILLASQSQGDVAIGNETDQVGRYLMEHPHFYDVARIVVAADMGFEALPESFGPASPALAPTDEMFRQTGGLDASFQLQQADINPADNVEQYIVQTLGGSARAYNVDIRSEMPPDPQNRVMLAQGRDPSGMPRLRASCMVSGEALRAVDSYLRQMGALLAREGRGRVRIDNEEIYRNVAGGGHTMGTTRMGDDPRTSVVDANCRVHGYTNLSVAGSSVFPTGGYANPTLTIVALALRLADHLGDAQ